MCVQSPFMKDLIKNGQMVGHPVTDWSCISSRPDEVVSWDSATNLNACNAYVYMTTSQPEAYNHGRYLTDQSTLLNKWVTYEYGPLARSQGYNPNNGYAKSSNAFPRGNYLALQTISGGSDRSTVPWP